MTTAPLRGLYAITPETDADLCGPVAAALRGGARLVQYRSKSVDARLRADQARQLVALCSAAGAQLIINDDVRLARDLGVGVHLGRDDTTVADARATLGPGAVIGASCYDSLRRAHDAVADGADYVAFGSFFLSPTKPAAVRAGSELLAGARVALGVPVCAIGGITPQNGAALVAAGADMLAVLSGVFASVDVEAAARAYAGLFTSRNA